MPKDFLAGIKDRYDAVIIGSGLAGLTCANQLAKVGHSVAIFEHHYQLGGMATWFNRKRGNIFDISLHGFPIGMIKSCRKYWTREISDSIEQLKGVVFDNPQFSFETTFDEHDFTSKLIDYFKVPKETVDDFFKTVRAMEYYDDDGKTTRELFKRFFPGRKDVWRLLMEPIAYANGSTLDDPAITYGIVFSNFMSKGVYIYKGGTDKLIRLMRAELEKNGVDIRTSCSVDGIVFEGGRAIGAIVNGRKISAGAIVSNANLRTTVEKIIKPENLPADFVEEARAVRPSTSSCQVYIGIREGETLDYIGDLLFTSVATDFDSDALLGKEVTSRTFSMYYPDTRPDKNRYAVVSSTNARWEDWANLSEEEYKSEKDKLIADTLDALEKYSPGVRDKIDWLEASTPKTFNHYTRTLEGATFGTKFEGLKVSQSLPEKIGGMYHTGSVGIIMSGWLGTVNYGVIVANKVDGYIRSNNSR